MKKFSYPTVKINADRLRYNGINLAGILNRPIGAVANVTEAEMAKIAAEVKRLSRTRSMVEVIEYLAWH